MKNVSVFYQTEKTPEFNHVEVEVEQTIGAVKTLILEKHGADPATLIFLEDGEEPLDERLTVATLEQRKGVKFHLHRCRHIEIAVNFAGKTETRAFAPAATIARVKRWAAEQFGMTSEDASEHVLQLAGSQDRPTPGTHVGSLASCPACRLTSISWPSSG